MARGRASGTAIEHRAIPGSDTRMVLLQKPAGTFRDVESPNLILIQCMSHRVLRRVEFGEDRTPRSVRMGDIIVVPPDRSTAFKVSDPHLIRVTSLRVPDIEGAAHIGKSTMFSRVDRQPIRNELVWALCERLWTAGGMSSTVGRLMVDGVSMTIVAELLEGRGNQEIAKSCGLADGQVRRVCEMLSSDLSETVGIQHLANSVGLSPFHFCRAFRRRMNETPHGWLRRRRIERAKELMKSNPHQSLDSIAAELGYSGLSAFGTAFRSLTGIAPTVWRRNV